MDGNPFPKNKKWRGNTYSETRYAVVKWLEKELPLISGDVLIVSAGNWLVPKQLLSNKAINSITTFDKKHYGNTKNNVDVIGDIHNMPIDWSNKWDCIVNNQAIECYENPFKAAQEMYRVLKPQGILLLDSPFNYRWFGKGSWADPKQNAKNVQDYWRITPQGMELLLKDFSEVKIELSGPNKWDPYCVMAKAIK